MKKFKKIFSLILCFSMLFCSFVTFSACKYNKLSTNQQISKILESCNEKISKSCGVIGENEQTSMNLESDSKFDFDKLFETFGVGNTFFSKQKKEVTFSSEYYNSLYCVAQVIYYSNYIANYCEIPNHGWVKVEDISNEISVYFNFKLNTSLKTLEVVGGENEHLIIYYDNDYNAIKVEARVITDGFDSYILVYLSSNLGKGIDTYVKLEKNCSETYVENYLNGKAYLFNAIDVKNGYFYNEEYKYVDDNECPGIVSFYYNKIAEIKAGNDIVHEMLTSENLEIPNVYNIVKNLIDAE